MASTSIKLFTKSIFETAGTVTIAGDPDTGYPESRLYDRSISLYWKDTADTTGYFYADHSSSTPTVDFLAIEKHNFSGETMTWEYSSDNAAWTKASTDWLQGDNNQIIKTISSPTTLGDYWRVTVTQTSNPQCSEVYVSHGFEYDILSSPAPRKASVSNVQWNRSLGGVERATKFGDTRKSRTYTLFLSSTELTDFRNNMADLDELSKPFYIKDDDGNYWMARLVGDPVETPDHPDHTHVTINLLEQL